MAFMFIALGMAFFLRYSLAKYPYPELAIEDHNPPDKMGSKGDLA